MRMLHPLLCLLLALPVIGEFSNMRFTGEHAYGYSVQLWRNGDNLMGLFLASEGLAGDTPTGILENLKFDARTGKLSFRAKLTMGVEVLGNGRQASTRDLFEFDGTLTKTALAGTLKRSPGRVERVKLAKQKENSTIEAATYEEWKKQVDEILRYRGPKW